MADADRSLATLARDTKSYAMRTTLVAPTGEAVEYCRLISPEVVQEFAGGADCLSRFYTEDALYALNRAMSDLLTKERE